MTDPVMQIANAISDVTGINHQLTTIQQCTKAVTDPKGYLADYQAALKDLQKRGAD